jgi:hypothetical protein
MESEVLKSMVQFGPFALLFAFLLFYVLRTNDIREKRYIQREDVYQRTISDNQVIIKELTEKFCIVDGIKSDVTSIKEKLERV